MKITVAITDAEAATPVLRSVSMIVPQAHMLANLKDLATGTFPFAGAVQMEAKVSDSQTGKIMAAVVGRRAGGGSVETGFQWEWGDAERPPSISGAKELPTDCITRLPARKLRKQFSNIHAHRL